MDNAQSIAGNATRNAGPALIDHWIDGAAVTPADGRRGEVFNPATGT